MSKDKKYKKDKSLLNSNKFTKNSGLPSGIDFNKLSESLKNNKGKTPIDAYFSQQKEREEKLKNKNG